MVKSLNEKQNDAPIAQKILINPKLDWLNIMNCIRIFFFCMLFFIILCIINNKFLKLDIKMFRRLIIIISFISVSLSNSAFGDDILKGFEAYKNNDYKTAYLIWSKLAEEGDSIAQNSLGVLFQKGQGVEKNYFESYKWFKTSAEDGYTPAQVSLGYLYDQGMGIDRNKIKAFMWWKIASLHGDNDAKTLFQILLTEMNENEKLLASTQTDKCLNNNFKNC